MKLLLENWREYIDQQDEVLEEGWKDWLVAGLIGLSTLAPSAAKAAPQDSGPEKVQTQVQTQSIDAKSLNTKQRRMIRGAMYLMTHDDSPGKKLSEESKQLLLKAAWTLQVTDDADSTTDEFLKTAWEVIQDDDQSMLDTYEEFGKKVKVLKRTERGHVRKTGQPTQYVERTAYEWGDASEAGGY